MNLEEFTNLVIRSHISAASIEGVGASKVEFAAIEHEVGSLSIDKAISRSQ